jgi:hypothetical protein
MASLLDIVDDLEVSGTPKLDPRVFVEPADKRKVKEITRQAEAVLYLRKYAKRVVVFAVPNAAKDTGTKLRQHREGAIYGAADLVCAWTDGVAFIEMKNATTMPRANQVEFLNGLAAREHHVAVCRSAEGVANFLASVGAPVGAVR